MKTQSSTRLQRLTRGLVSGIFTFTAVLILSPATLRAQDKGAPSEGKTEPGTPTAEVVERLLKKARKNGGRLELSPRQLQELGGMDELMKQLKQGLAEDKKEGAKKTEEEKGKTPEPKENGEKEGKKEETPDKSKKEEQGKKKGAVPGVDKLLDLMNGFSKNRSVAETEKLDPTTLAAYKPVVRNAAKSTVRILKEGKQVALGTIVDVDGWVLTKASELGEGPLRAQLYGGITIPARVMDVDKLHDLALVQLGATGVKSIEWAEEPVIGSLLASPTAGDLPIGIGALSVASRNLNEAEKGFLGVQLGEDEKGAKVTAVVPNSPAQKAGLQVDDVVYSVEGTEVKKVSELIELVSGRKPKETITVALHRGDEKKELKVTLGSRAMLGTSTMPGRNDMMNRMGNKMSANRSGYPCALQHDLVIQPNQVGGPVVGLDGRAIGINIARSGRVMSYAIPATHLKELLGNIKNGKLGPKVDYSAIIEELKNLEGLVDKISGTSKEATAAKADLEKALEGLRKLAEKK